MKKYWKYVNYISSLNKGTLIPKTSIASKSYKPNTTMFKFMNKKGFICKSLDITTL